MASGAQNPVVKLTITAVDLNTGKVVGTTVKTLDSLGEAGIRAGKQVDAGMREAGTSSAAAAAQVEAGVKRANDAIVNIGKTGQEAGTRGAAGISKTADAAKAMERDAVAGYRRASAAGDAFTAKVLSNNKRIQQSNSSSARSSSGGDFSASSFSTGEQVAGFKRVSDAAHEAGEHALEPIDKVRLLRDQLGLPITGAMEKILSSSKLAMTAIGGIGSALAIVGVAMLGFDIGKQFYEGYKEAHNVNAEMAKYSQQAQQNAKEDLFNNASLETTRTLLSQVDQQIGSINNKRVAAGVAENSSGAFMQYARALFTDDGGSGAGNGLAAAHTVQQPNLYGKKDDARLAELNADRDVLKARAEVQGQQRRLDDAQARAAAASAAATPLGGIQQSVRNAAELANLKQQQAQQEEALKVADRNRLRAQQLREGTKQEDLSPEYHADRNAGREQRDAEVRNAQMQAQAEMTAFSRRESEEVSRAEADARATGLRGEQAYIAQRNNAVADLHRREVNGEMTTAAATREAAALKLKYSREYAERRRQENEQTLQAEAEGRDAGLTGMAQQDAELQERIRQLHAAEPDNSDPGTAARRIAAAQQATLAQELRAAQDYNDHLQGMDEAREAQFGGANQRIDAQTRQTVREITKSWDDMYGKLAPLDERRVRSAAALQEEIASINRAAARQKAIEERRLVDETLSIEAAAARASLPRYQQETMAILDDAADRTRRLQEQQRQDRDNYELYARQIVAIDAQKNARLVDAQRDLRDRLAGNLRGILSNPAEFFKDQAEQMASKQAANTLMRLAPGFSQKLALGDERGGLFDVPAAGQNGIKDVVTGFGGKYASDGNTGHVETHTAAATLNASTAVIHVGSATVLGLGGGTSKGAQGGGMYVPTGNGGFFNLGASPDAGSSSPASPASGGSQLLSVGTEAFSRYADAGGNSAEGGAGSGMPGLESTDLSGFGVNDENGDPTILSQSGNADGAGSAMGGAGGAINGAMGLYSVWQGKGGWGGAAKGALNGAQVGMQYGGLAGAAIGAVVGGVLGYVGHGARVAAQKYFFEEVEPHIQQDLRGFEAGTSDYQSVYDDLGNLQIDAKRRTEQMGSGAEDYYGSRIKPSIDEAMQRLTREQKAGRAGMGMTAAQFHDGGFIRDFGSMATSGNEGWIHAERGEMMLNQQAAMRHGDVAMLMNANVSRSGLADYLGGGRNGGTMQLAQQAPVVFQVSAIDSRGVQQFFDQHGDKIRSSLNRSKVDNSGGAD